MSMQIEDLDDLKALLKTCKVTVGDIEEMKSLLAAINANYNPDAARVKVAKRMGILVPTIAFVVAGAVSVFLSSGEGIQSRYWLAALAVLWGVTGLVSIIATIFTSIVLLARRPAAEARQAGAPAPLGSAFAHAFTDRPLNSGRPDGPH
jgi:formate-dependent nitrite reductase membrane component NrfD